MNSVQKLQQEIELIKERNKRVGADKAWETSLERKVLIAVLTYFVVVLFFWIAQLPQPFISAFVPTLGFMLSTLTLSIFKKWWLQKRGKNEQ